MTIGQRIEIARKAAQKSQRALAEAIGLTPMAISKYERDEITPSSGALLKLSQALGVQVEYFFRPLRHKVELKVFRKHASLGKKDQDTIAARIQEWLERYLELEELVLFSPTPFVLPKFSVHSLAEAEQAASGLREQWHLGLDPIENLTEVLEDQGIKVGQVEGFPKFHACTFMASDNRPVIVINSDSPGDRQRFSLGHELGHIVMELASEIDPEKAANRFAGAFLVPYQSAFQALGQNRSDLGMYELYLLKQKYGLSMQAWVHRATDLEIITPQTAQRLYQQFHVQGYHRKEPGELIASEKPRRMEQLVSRALAEDLVSHSRAKELLGNADLDQWIIGNEQDDVATIAAGVGH